MNRSIPTQRMKLQNQGLLSLLFVLAGALPGFAQLCVPGSVSAIPVFALDFGQGSGPTARSPLSAASGSTGYTYSTGGMGAKTYCLIPTTAPFSWGRNVSDHTGNPNGNLMYFDMDQAGELAYEKEITGLLPNTLYEFKAYLANANPVGSTNPPIVDFKILDAVTKAVLTAPYNTGDIQATSPFRWEAHAIQFNSGTATSVVFQMVSGRSGGGGNDLLLDDITVGACDACMNDANKPSFGPIANPVESTN